MSVEALMASKGIPVVKARLGGFEGISGFGQIPIAETARRNRLTVAVENLEQNRETLGAPATLSQATAIKAELEAGSRWDDYRSSSGAFLKNLWYEKEEKYYYKYTDLTARLREIINWASGRGAFDAGTAANFRPYGTALETIRQAPEPVADRITQIAKEDVIPAAKKLGTRLQEDDLFRKRFLVVLGALVILLIIKRI